MNKFLRLTGWDKYQHYKQRNPPWIKLHRSILQSHAFMSLDDDSKLLAFVCIVLAGDSNNRIPLDRDFIQARAGLKKRPDIRPLLKSGFAELLEECEQDASTLLQNSPSEKETYKQETEKETEVIKPPPEIGIDHATTKVFLEVGLAGNEARMLVHDAVNAYVHEHKCSFAIAADALITVWGEYENTPLQFKKGVFKFFKEGLWKPNQVKDWRHGTPTAKEQDKPDLSVHADPDCRACYGGGYEHKEGKLVPCGCTRRALAGRPDRQPRGSQALGDSRSTETRVAEENSGRSVGKAAVV